VKMLQADFATIVRELMPDSRERIELLGGVPLDDSTTES
jgi:type VI secretion system protein ImpA